MIVVCSFLHLTYLLIHVTHIVFTCDVISVSPTDLIVVECQHTSVLSSPTCVGYIKLLSSSFDNDSVV